MGYVLVVYARYPRWLLSLDRAAVITGGVSPYVPTAFLMGALDAWLYARRRIRAINDTFAFNQSYTYNTSDEPAAGANRSTLRRIDGHRARCWDMTAELPQTSVPWQREKVVSHLAVLEERVREERTANVDLAGREVESFRYLARALSPYWADAAMVADTGADKQAADKKGAELSREEKLIEHLENILALEAARWVGGALVRVWISIGFLALSAAAMLFAITSYPFPEQSRVMTVIGLAIAALVFMILKVALGSSRNEVISKIDGTAPGRITWDSTLFSTMATYVVPLLGLLTAVSFDMLDLFRSVLGPILRLFP